MPDPSLIAPPWVPLTPKFTCKPEHRSAEHYIAVLAQFDVLSSPRYVAIDGETWCNIFAWDVSRAMGAEIPHWIDGKGNPVSVGRGAELTANATAVWLEVFGRAHGWEPVAPEAAEERARAGYPTVAAWRNPNPHLHGHIACVMPGPERVLTIAQAGKRNLFGAPLVKGFGDIRPKFFTAP